MLLDHKPHTVGDRKKYIVDYSQWLNAGDRLVPFVFSATTTSLTASIDTVTVPTNTTLQFFVNGGVLNEIFTVSIQITTLLGEVKNDTVEFFVTAP